jgi:2-phosphosulfolactate phosphatase
MYYDQKEYNVKFEWGLDGIYELLPVSDIIIIVDVLSFSTCVDIATNNGAIVYPYKWKDQSALTYAAEKEAILADANRKKRNAYTLSPASLLNSSLGEKIVLPSPNGATLSLAPQDTLTICGCLRNAKVIADFCLKKGKRISVIAAGEKWNTSKNLRVAIEDLLGAGAILSYLGTHLSPEAESARTFFETNQSDLLSVLSKSASGKELIGRGFKEDVLLASALNTSLNVPVLSNEAYRSISFSN